MTIVKTNFGGQKQFQDIFPFSLTYSHFPGYVLEMFLGKHP